MDYRHRLAASTLCIVAAISMAQVAIDDITDTVVNNSTIDISASHTGPNTEVHESTNLRGWRFVHDRRRLRVSPWRGSGKTRSPWQIVECPTWQDASNWIVTARLKVTTNQWAAFREEIKLQAAEDAASIGDKKSP